MNSHKWSPGPKINDRHSNKQNNEESKQKCRLEPAVNEITLGVYVCVCGGGGEGGGGGLDMFATDQPSHLVLLWFISDFARAEDS